MALKIKEFGKPASCKFKNLTLPLVLVVAHTCWDEPPRMRHDVARQMMRWCNVLFVEFFATGYKGVDGWKQENDRLLIYRPELSFHVPVRLYANEPVTHSFVNRCYAKKIRAAVQSLNASTVILFNFSWNFQEIMLPNAFKYKAYICVDEFPKMHSRSRHMLKTAYQNRLFQHYENMVVLRSDHCFTCHRPLYEKFRRLGGDVDFLYHANPYKEQIVPADRKGRNKIHVGFGGYIDYRILYDWIRTVIEQPDMVLHLIGMPEKGCEDQFKEYDNVCFHTHLPDSEFAEKLAEMDVLIMPYDSSIPEVRVMTTNSKTFQYVAVGRPMVISDMPNYHEFPSGVIYAAKSPEEFIRQIRTAHEEDCEEYQEVRAKIAAENTWDKRGEQLHSVLRKALGNAMPDL